MSIKHLLAVFILACLGRCAMAEQPTNGVPNKQQIWGLIPKSADAPLGAQEQKDIKRVIGYGPAVLPVLAELLNEQADEKTRFSRLMVSRIIAIAQQVEGDREPVLSVLRHLLTYQDEDVRRYAVTGVGAMGKVRDADVLLPLMKDPSEVIRVNTVHALGKIGDEDVATKMESILQERKSGLTNDQIRRDNSFVHGYQAISNIVARYTSAEERKQGR